MSRSWANGSTRQWRRLRRLVLERDRYSCRRVDPETGETCGAYAEHAGHWPIPKSRGGQDSMDNLRAECAKHNTGDGARLRTPRKATRSWSW